MGFTPDQVRRMSVFDFMATLDGYIAANSPEEAGKLSEDEKDDLWAWLQAG